MAYRRRSRSRSRSTTTRKYRRPQKRRSRRTTRGRKRKTVPQRQRRYDAFKNSTYETEGHVSFLRETYGTYINGTYIINGNQAADDVIDTIISKAVQSVGGHKEPPPIVAGPPTNRYNDWKYPLQNKEMLLGILRRDLASYLKYENNWQEWKVLNLSTGNSVKVR